MENEFKGLFKNVLEVEQYLIAKGWKIKKSSIYNHVKDRKLITNALGQFDLAEVDRYALTNLRKADGTTAENKKADKIALEAASMRRRRESAHAAILEHKLSVLQGAFVPRDLFETELAGRAAIFKCDGESFFRSEAPEIVNIVSGDPLKIPDLISFCLDKFEQWLARYLRREDFKVDPSAYEKIFEMTGKDEDEEEGLNDED